MIVKTGANYQAEGGYIEFAKGEDYIIIGDKKIPTDISENSLYIMGFNPVKISKSDQVASTIAVYAYEPLTMISGETVTVSKYHELKVSPETVIMPLGIGNLIATSAGAVPVLLEGSKDVKIEQYGTSYYIVITGEDPVVYMGVE